MGDLGDSRVGLPTRLQEYRTQMAEMQHGNLYTGQYLSILCATRLDRLQALRIQGNGHLRPSRRSQEVIESAD